MLVMLTSVECSWREWLESCPAWRLVLCFTSHLLTCYSINLTLRQQTPATTITTLGWRLISWSYFVESQYWDLREIREVLWVIVFVILRRKTSHPLGQCLIHLLIFSCKKYLCAMCIVCCLWHNYDKKEMWDQTPVVEFRR